MEINNFVLDFNTILKPQEVYYENYKWLEILNVNISKTGETDLIFLQG